MSKTKPSVIRPTVNLPEGLSGDEFQAMIDEAVAAAGMSKGDFIRDAILAALNPTTATTPDLFDDQKYQCFASYSVSENSAARNADQKRDRFVALKEAVGADPEAEEIVLSLPQLLEITAAKTQRSKSDLIRLGTKMYCEDQLNKSLALESINADHTAHGVTGVNDTLLDQNYFEICQDILNGTFDPRKELITVTMIAARGVKAVGYPTALNWVEKRGYTELLEEHPEAKGRGKKGVLVSFVKENPGFVKKLEAIINK